METFLKRIALPLLVIILATLACDQSTPTPAPLDSYTLLTAKKYTPEMDFWPPTITGSWSQPVPLPYPVNTSGAEDSPFILPDNQTLYFFFTPDVSIPAGKQILDGVTGIWVTHRSGGTWTEPERVRLSDPDELALDGCEFIRGDLMYFCTTRKGFIGIEWFSAKLMDGVWQDWGYASDDLKYNEYQVGELHITADGQELFFHSSRPGGYGGLDIWVSQKTPTGWGKPVNLGPAVNTSADEGWPFINSDGQELWFTGQSSKGKPGPAIFRSLLQPDGSWDEAVEVVSSFAGEPSLSGDGKALYFVHHFFSEDMRTMLDADIYVSYKVP
jgi:hypothetical protein